MTTTIIDKALAQIGPDIGTLIEEHADAIRAAISNQMLITAEEENETDKLVFSISIGVKITPFGDNADVATSIGWAVKEKKTMSTNVSDQPQLPLEQ